MYSYQWIFVWNCMRATTSALGWNRVFFIADFQALQCKPDCSLRHAESLRMFILITIWMLRHSLPQGFHINLCRWLIARRLRFNSLLPAKQCSYGYMKTITGLSKGEFLLLFDCEDTFSKIQWVGHRPLWYSLRMKMTNYIGLALVTFSVTVTFVQCNENEWRFLILTWDIFQMRLPVSCR